jgi:hypothetical protein
MNRQEAADLLKELLDMFCFLEGKSFALMPPISPKTSHRMAL